ncbi:MAG: universal stress protein, partial [Candidatus Tectomicrobia bacterium]|nr:universal stress protein [Candidatus Tectomicrobia bacterium]
MTAFGQNIVVALDLQRDWRHVVEHATQFAQWAEATLHLVYVVPDPRLSAYGVLDKTERRVHMRRLGEEARTQMEDTGRELKEKGIPSQVTLLRGKQAAKAILKHAQSMKAGLIVAGASRTAGAEFLFVGTTADRLLRHSHVPVLIAGPELTHPLKRILAPTDLERSSQGAIRLACTLATLNEGQASVLHAYAHPAPLHGDHGDALSLSQ